MHELEAIGGKNPFSPPLAFFGLAVVYVYVQGREKLKAIDLLSSAINFQLSCWDKNFWAKNGSSRERDSTRTAGSNAGVMTIPERFVDPLLQNVLNFCYKCDLRSWNALCSARDFAKLSGPYQLENVKNRP